MTPKFNITFTKLIQESIGRTLYHGTIKSIFPKKYSLKDIHLFGGGDPKAKEDVEDDHESLVDSFYDDEEDERETPLFAADKTTFDKAVTAMVYNLARKKSKKDWPDYKSVTWNDIRNNGIIFVFYDTEWNQYNPNSWESEEQANEYRGLETDDYYTDYAKPDGWWEGSKLVRMLKRKGYKFKN